MKPAIRSFLFLFALLLPFVARADDWTGFGMFLVGAGSLVTVLPLFLILACFPRLHAFIYGIATVIFSVMLMFWMLFAPDSLTYIEREIRKQRGLELLWNPLLLVLPVTIALFALISWRYARARKARRGLAGKAID
jgi:hypothetical protein